LKRRAQLLISSFRGIGQRQGVCIGSKWIEVLEADAILHADASQQLFARAHIFKVICEDAATTYSRYVTLSSPVSNSRSATTVPVKPGGGDAAVMVPHCRATSFTPTVRGAYTYSKIGVHIGT